MSFAYDTYMCYSLCKGGYSIAFSLIFIFLLMMSCVTDSQLFIHADITIKHVLFQLPVIQQIDNSDNTSASVQVGYSFLGLPTTSTLQIDI